MTVLQPLHSSTALVGTPVKNQMTLLDQFYCPCWWHLAHSDYEEDTRFILHSFTYTTSIKEVKSTVPHEQCWWNAHLPYLGLEPIGG